MPPKHCVIGRVSWRLDGFVSLDRAAFEGRVETVPLVAAGRRLVVNADAGAGSVAVEVLAADGTPLEGYGAGDCTPLRADEVRHGVTWGARVRLPANRPVRLRFRLHDADLYSYRLLD